MEWKQTESRQSPNLIDATSCPGKLYVRTDIREETREEGTMYVYKEALMTQEEYQNYSGERAEKTGTGDNQEIIMGALAEIAEMLLSMQG